MVKADLITHPLTGCAIMHSQMCVTGELTLRGVVNGIGHLAHKMSAKNRSWIDTIIIPSSNTNEASELPTCPNENGKRPLEPQEKLDHIGVEDMQGVLRTYVDIEGEYEQKE